MEVKILQDYIAPNGTSEGVTLYKNVSTDTISYKNRNGVILPLGSSGGTVFDSVVATGTTLSNTKTTLSYGVNVFTTITSTNRAAKLPAAITGQIVIVVNNTTSALTLYPSMVGGSINGVVDGVATVPPDGKPYSFYCIKNPLPGAWTWSAPATSQIVLAEISISHTQGVASGGYGYTTANLGVGIGSVYNAGNISLTGNWLSENVPTSLIKMKTYTNILASDLASTSVMDDISVELYQTAKDSSTSVKFAQEVRQYFNGSSLNLSVNGGALNSPVQVGDVDTLYMETVPYNGNNGFTDQLGIGGQFSRAYYTFAFGISASAATKDYKFQIILEVLQ